MTLRTSSAAVSNDSMWQALIAELRANEFGDVQGAEAALVLPMSDRLVTRLARGWLSALPPDSPVKDVDLRADGDDQLTVVVRVKQPAFLPPFTIGLAIEQQPMLPSQPQLIVRLRSQGLAALAGPIARLFAKLPAGVVFEDGRIVLDIARLAAAYPGGAEVIRHLTVLELHATPGRFIVTVRGALQ